MNTLVLGLGNDLRGDDGIGMHIVNYVRTHHTPHEKVHIHLSSASGLQLMHMLYSYQRVMVVDAVEVDDRYTGYFWKLNPEQLPGLSFPAYPFIHGSREGSGQIASTHGTGFLALLELGKKMGFKDPQEVFFYLIGIRRQTNPYSMMISEKIGKYLLSIIPKVGEEIVASLKNANTKGALHYG